MRNEFVFAKVSVPYALWAALPDLEVFIMGVLARKATAEYIGRLTFDKSWDEHGCWVITCSGVANSIPR